MGNNGKVCYLQIPAGDVNASAEFYEKIFGWNLRLSEGHAAFDDTTGQVSGMWVPGVPPATHAGIVISIMVDSIRDTLDQIVAAGGSITQPIGFQAPELTAHFRDPYGNEIGLYEERG